MKKKKKFGVTFLAQCIVEISFQRASFGAMDQPKMRERDLALFNNNKFIFGKRRQALDIFNQNIAIK